MENKNALTGKWRVYCLFVSEFLWVWLTVQKITNKFVLHVDESVKTYKHGGINQRLCA